MKIRSLLLVLLMAMSTSIFAQVKVNVFINGTMAGQYELKKGQTDGGISYKKKDYRNLDKLTIEVSGKAVGGGYIRTVEITGDGEKIVHTAAETQGVTGQFILSEKNVIKRLTRGKPVKLYLVKTPANTLSKETVKRIYIGTLSRT